MNALDLVHELANHGIRVEVHGDRLSLEGPEDILTDELAERLRRHKAELLELYRQDTSEIRTRLLADLEANSDLVRAVEVIDSDAGQVRVIIAVRGTGTCELQIDAARWDPIRFLELVESGGRAS